MSKKNIYTMSAEWPPDYLDDINTITKNNIIKKKINKNTICCEWPPEPENHSMVNNNSKYYGMCLIDRDLDIDNDPLKWDLNYNNGHCF